MALTIYKISEYINWKATGGATYINGGGVSGSVPPTDLSNYYTKSNLQTAGESIVNWDNISGLSFINSIDETAGVVQLVSDQAAPGVSMLYGTDEYGVKGWFEQPVSGGGEVGISGVPQANQVAIWTSADHIGGSTGLTYDGSVLDITGNFHINSGEATGGDFILDSDRRLKQNIKDYEPEFMDIAYHQFEIKTQPGQVRFGVIAQEVEDQYPELVRRNGGNLAVSYFDLLIREIVYLKSKVAELEAKLK